MFKGSMPALVTPFSNGELDLDALKRLVEWQIAEGSTGLVPVGTTGESPTLTHEEHELVIAETVKAAAGRVPVIAGAGSNNTVYLQVGGALQTTPGWTSTDNAN